MWRKAPDKKQDAFWSIYLTVFSWLCARAHAWYGTLPLGGSTTTALPPAPPSGVEPEPNGSPPGSSGMVRTDPSRFHCARVRLRQYPFKSGLPSAVRGGLNVLALCCAHRQKRAGSSDMQLLWVEGAGDPWPAAADSGSRRT